MRHLKISTRYYLTNLPFPKWLIWSEYPAQLTEHSNTSLTLLLTSKLINHQTPTKDFIFNEKYEINIRIIASCEIPPPPLIKSYQNASFINLLARQAIPLFQNTKLTAEVRMKTTKGSTGV